MTLNSSIMAWIVFIIIYFENVNFLYAKGQIRHTTSGIGTTGLARWADLHFLEHD